MSLEPASTETNGSRTSSDSDRLSNGSPTKGLNGTNHDHNEDFSDMEPVQRLQLELARAREEKEALATQYNNLLAKLTTMRTTLGNKLKQDAEELDRQEQLVQQLTAQNDDLAVTVETLKSELIASNAESERASLELEAMRSKAFQENAQEVVVRERELREMQSELEHVRIERDEWEQKALQEHIVADEATSSLELARRDLEIERDARERDAAALLVEREKVNNLQSVLEDFQAAKESEIHEAVKDHESRFLQITQSLAEYKHRAVTAEMQLEESSTNSSKTQQLEKDLKEKNLLIGKLRHEAVIMNEHLMEALRRLRRSSSDTNVDRRLVTNVLLSFLNTPRADSKRFEMLSLLASILQWNDDEREKAGLQRKGGSSIASSLWNKATGKGKSPELDKTDETESFSKLWVEFLLTEATSGDSSTPSSPRSPPSRANNSLPGTPTHSTPPVYLSPGSLKGGKCLPSFTSSAMASSPNLNVVLNSPPSKGKGKERQLSDS
ncbi:hypothetical protein BDY19DRAFT_940146 [Irpex rosettiformis]|uniref:Uncharacterized protein n=1 Tax=Irpex rosettiformis TaxID=378272 RepID=A0ACB8U7W3_9APHY|nr:hypothetical protein BDY19DRAFT_940146 [Irpex rosettiformis]